MLQMNCHSKLPVSGYYVTFKYIYFAFRFIIFSFVFTVDYSRDDSTVLPLASLAGKHKHSRSSENCIDGPLQIQSMPPCPQPHPQLHQHRTFSPAALSTTTLSVQLSPQPLGQLRACDAAPQHSDGGSEEEFVCGDGGNGHISVSEAHWRWPSFSFATCIPCCKEISP